ncbi:hypothetical protein C8Q80DRAFT_1118380 [Daedaleopsis nitida]|nr:hypothetical protein C8Q80DRAFT_1118380 [Daedaleopsis nitida]
MTEAEWTILSSPFDNVGSYSRPLLGSELFADQVMQSGDGFGECCMGITFTTALTSDDLLIRTKEALMRFRTAGSIPCRYEAPIAAATLQSGIHDPQLRSWVYTPIKSTEQLQEWVANTLMIVQDPVDPSQFIQRMNCQRLPYILGNEQSQYLRLYITRPSGTTNEFALFFHGTHALMDAHPTMNALSLLLNDISTSAPIDLGSLKWGLEWKNLPPGPITSTGGPRTQSDWDTAGKELMGKIVNLYTNPVPPHSLKCESLRASVPGRPRRLLTELTSAETSKILAAVKAHRCSVSHLIDAAVSLATFKMSPVSPEDVENAHITYGSSLISLERYLVPPHQSKGHFVSRFVLVPVVVRYKDIVCIEDEKERLTAAMISLKKQYIEYLENPCLPHLMAEQMRLAPPREGLPMVNPCVSTVTNVGNVEKLLPVLWRSDTSAGSTPSLRVSGLHFGNRITLPTPMVHIWTMHGRLFIQIQATDNWDDRALQEYMHEIVRQMILLLD